MKKTDRLRENLFYFFKILKKSLIERLSVMSVIFGYSFLVAVISGMFLLLLVKYFLYASFFLMGVFFCAFIAGVEEDLFNRLLSFIKHISCQVRSWLLSLSETNHHC